MSRVITNVKKKKQRDKLQPVPMAQTAAVAIIPAKYPARLTKNQVLNFELKKDIGYYKRSNKKLDSDPYDGMNLPVFLKKYDAKMQQFNWTGLLLYVYQGNPPVRKNLITHYGDVTRDEVQQKAMTCFRMYIKIRSVICFLTA
jgi:hypothetical protein